MWYPRSRHDGGRNLKVEDKKCCLLIGNSRWHWAIERNDAWHYFHTNADPKKLSVLEIPLVSWAAVGPIPKNASLNPTKRLTVKDVPLKNLPHWVGIDRALASWGALKKAEFTEINSCGLLIADAGTVLSVNRITENGEFAGGQLIPGLRLQLEAMATGAHNLNNPGFSLSTQELFPFKTDEAMQRGSIQALIGTLIEAINETNTPLWLCGGDAPVLIKELKKRNKNVFHHPNLVLEGMVDIQHQINQEQDL